MRESNGRDTLQHVTIVVRKWLPNMGKLSQASSLNLLNRHDRSVSKNTYAHTNEGDWCENHSDNVSRFGGRPLKS